MRHLVNPRAVVPQSNMPAYPWLATNMVDDTTIARHMKGLRTVGVPYSDEEIAAAPAAVKGKTEMEAVIAYLQGLGLALANKIGVTMDAITITRIAVTIISMMSFGVLAWSGHLAGKMPIP